AGEQKRVVHTAARQRIDERAPHVFLPDQLGKSSRAPFARQRHVTLGAHLTICRACLEVSAPSAAARTITSPFPSGGGPHQPWLRHPTLPLPLLPSGPDGVHG